MGWRGDHGAPFAVADCAGYRLLAGAGVGARWRDQRVKVTKNDDEPWSRMIQSEWREDGRRLTRLLGHREMGEGEAASERVCRRIRGPLAECQRRAGAAPAGGLLTSTVRR